MIKYLFWIILVCFYLHSSSQSLSDEDVKQLAKEINDEAAGTDLGDGMYIIRCFALGRTLIYQYEVNEYWAPKKNMKQDILQNFKEADIADVYFRNNINVEFHYYFDRKLQKRVTIKSNEFSNLNFSLGEYISIKGHPKAKGVDLKLKAPIGWNINEGDRPNIVKKFNYKDNSYMIIIKDNLTFFSKKETLEILNDEETISEFISESSSYLKNAEILSKEIVTIDKYPTLEFTFSGQMERSGIKLSLIFKTWVILYEDKIVTVQGGSINKKEFYTLESIYNSITSSIIFPEQYNY